MMANQEMETLIQKYVTAYNNFDIEGMIALVHPEVVFKNVTGSNVNVELIGIEELRKLATESKSLFSSRQQTIRDLTFNQDKVMLQIDYEAVLAVDFPNGLKTGDTLRLNGCSEFEFKDGKIFKITDYS